MHDILKAYKYIMILSINIRYPCLPNGGKSTTTKTNRSSSHDFGHSDGNILYVIKHGIAFFDAQLNEFVTIMDIKYVSATEQSIIQKTVVCRYLRTGSAEYTSYWYLAVKWCWMFFSLSEL